MTFEGKYFDGKSSAGYPAKIQLNSFNIQINYNDGVSSQSISWEPSKIHPNDFTSNGKIYLKYGDYPHQYIEVNDNRFAEELKLTYPTEKFHKGAYSFLFSTGFAGLAVLAAIVVALIAASYFFILPAVAEHLAATVPIEWEKQLGDASYSKMIEDESVDLENSKRMNEFFRQLHYQSDYKIDVVVVKDKVVNAFALPGGKIIVYEGILRTMNNSEELAALLSHEFSHVQLRHSTKNIFRSLSSYMLISVLLGDASGITAIVIQNANQLKQLGYSRTLEQEADKNGLKLMKQQHVDPKGMEDLFRELKKEEGSAGDIPQFLSTHPLTNERINYVRKEIAKHNYSIEEHEQLDSLWKEIKMNLEE